MQQIVHQHGAQYIPSSSHYDIIAGQGTVGLELGQQLNMNLDAVFVPIAGGGLIRYCHGSYML